MPVIDRNMLDEALEELDEAQTEQEAEDRLENLFEALGYRPRSFREANIFGNRGVCITNQVGVEFRLTIHKARW